ncbi:hypothetical protein D3C75_1042260 [compost metagenome]
MGIIDLKYVPLAFGICKRIRDHFEGAAGKIGGNTVIKRGSRGPDIGGFGNFYRHLARTRVKAEIRILFGIHSSIYRCRHRVVHSLSHIGSAVSLASLGR